MTNDDDQQFPLLYAMVISFRNWCSSFRWWWYFTITSVVDDIASTDAAAADDDVDDDARRITLLVKGEC